MVLTGALITVTVAAVILVNRIRTKMSVNALDSHFIVVLRQLAQTLTDQSAQHQLAQREGRKSARL